MKKFLSFLMILALVLSPAAGSARAAGEPADAAAVVGVKDAHRYANAFLGLIVDFGDDWYILDDEETLQAMGYVADSMEDPELADLLRSSGAICDLYAIALDDSGDNVNIQIEDLGFLYGMVMSEDAYCEAAAPRLEEALGQMGIADLRVEKGTMDFAGGEHAAVRISGTLQGTPLYECMALVKAGSYMATVTAFSFDAERAEALLAFFEEYSEETLAA